MEQEGTSLMEPTGAAPLRPTDLREIGPYRLLGRLGEGGMGTVFLARAPTGRFVALKVVKAEFANQEGFAARFHAEVDNARRVASFCTAQVLDNGNTGDGRPYMVTEYIAGTPLSDQIVTFGALDPGPLHGVALGVAAALAAIHVAGLVHRDLKPANVILSLSGPRVIDFGIARALDRETGFTLSGELLGSPGWWAPEQVRGELVSPAADVFAWGCLVAYAGNGRHPFGRGDPITMATRVLNTPPELGALPAPLNELVRRATAMDPAHRPTAQELLIALVGGSSPAISDNPPTLVATEMLTDWEPPQNVVDEPDVTATFTTPPPSDATGARNPGPGDAAGPGAGAGRPKVPGAFGADAGPDVRNAAGGAAGLAGGQAGARQASPDELARREEQAAREELARWEAEAQARRQEQERQLEQARQLARRQSASGGQPARPRPTTEPRPPYESRPPDEYRPTAESRPPTESRSTTESRPTTDTRPATDSQPFTGPRPTAERRSSAERRSAAEHRSAAGSRAVAGARSDEGTGPGALTYAPDEPDTLGGTRTKGTRWLIAAAAAVLAIVVTVTVLIVNSGRSPSSVATSNSPSRAVTNPRSGDVGRRLALGGNFDDPVVVVPEAPECGLTEFEGQTTTKGQLCVVHWTVINPGGERRRLVRPVVTMVDDKGGEHGPAPVTLPPALQPGGRVDGAFVFDLAPYRKPVKMSATMLENGRQIEVAL
ncbi:protein kinase [Nonomuraea sp. NPDC049758]|uniref:protein kinase domain-containing protein n=1 Tax=Nonomuraea sp. NPDC049758 TaxID=3154360 RepID=UPI00341FA219